MRNRDHNKKLISRLAFASFILMVGANILANIIPIGGVMTNEVAEAYDNLYTPAGWTFAIWFAIYVILGFYTFFQFTFNQRRPDNNDRVIRRVNMFFTVSNLLNVLWIVSWHYDRIFLSMVAIGGLLVTLYIIRVTISNRSTLNDREVRFMLVPFSVYLGWILAASIGQVMVYMASIQSQVLMERPEMTGIYAVVIGGLLIAVMMVQFKDIWIGLVALWAFSGILYRHLSPEGFDSLYTYMSLTLGIVCAVLIIEMVMVFMSTNRNKTHRRAR